MSHTARTSPHLVAGGAYLVLVGGLGVALVAAIAFAIGIGTVDFPVGRVV
jgi:iron complex transport system permease protein